MSGFGETWIALHKRMAKTDQISNLLNLQIFSGNHFRRKDTSKRFFPVSSISATQILAPALAAITPSIIPSVKTSESVNIEIRRIKEAIFALPSYPLHQVSSESVLSQNENENNLDGKFSGNEIRGVLPADEEARLARRIFKMNRLLGELNLAERMDSSAQPQESYTPFFVENRSSEIFPQSSFDPLNSQHQGQIEAVHHLQDLIEMHSTATARADMLEIVANRLQDISTLSNYRSIITSDMDKIENEENSGQNNDSLKRISKKLDQVEQLLNDLTNANGQISQEIRELEHLMEQVRKLQREGKIRPNQQI